MKNLKYILLIIIIILSSCINDELEKKLIEDKYIIYVVGVKDLMNGLMIVIYWKDGVVKELIFDFRSNVIVIVVVNNDVYILGKIENKVCYWKNGVVIYLFEGDEVNDIKVIGNDVYVVGLNNIVVCYWKNGVKIILGNNKGNLIVNKIIIEGVDVYISGG